MTIEEESLAGGILNEQLENQQKVMDLFKELEFKSKNPSAYYKIQQRIEGTTNLYVATKKPDYSKRFIIKNVQHTNLRKHNAWKGFYNEAVAHQTVESPYLIKFKEAYEHKKTYFIVSEYVDGSILSAVVKKRSELELSEDFCRYTLYCVAMGLQTLHQKFLVHRDIHSNNIFCSVDGQIKIAGLSQAYFLTLEQQSITELTAS